MASVFGTPSHGSGGAAGGEGWDTGRDSGAGFKNRTGQLLQQGGQGHTTPRSIWCRRETFTELKKESVGVCVCVWEEDRAG